MLVAIGNKQQIFNAFLSYQAQLVFSQLGGAGSSTMVGGELYWSIHLQAPCERCHSALTLSCLSPGISFPQCTSLTSYTADPSQRNQKTHEDRVVLSRKALPALVCQYKRF